jgi:SAM-dependent methyltransferase
MNENFRHLRARFTERLLALDPASVLDVGCGGGGLLATCRDRGVAAVGIEVARERLAAARSEGLSVVAAAAERLPFADGSFDWVTMHHVPHHLHDPRTALGEACRVARIGLFLAEPWNLPGLRGQDLALRFDDWMKAVERRLGRDHHPNHSPVELLALLADPSQWEVEVHQYLRLADKPRHDVESELQELLAELPARDEMRALGAELRRAIASEPLGYNGSSWVILRRRR